MQYHPVQVVEYPNNENREHFQSTLGTIFGHDQTTLATKSVHVIAHSKFSQADLPTLASSLASRTLRTFFRVVSRIASSMSYRAWQPLL